MATIFISYAHADKALLDILAPQIQNVYGYGSYWYDAEIRGGKDWWDTIKIEIESCQVFLFLMSDQSVASSYCLDELRTALQHRKEVLQVLLPTLTKKYEDALPADLHAQLKVEQYVDLRNELDSAQEYFKDLSRLWGALNGLVSRRRLPLTTTERWLLHNQFEILQQLNPDHPDYREDYFQNAREILAQGYEWYYDDIAQHIYTQIFPYGNALEVIHILNMFEDLQFAYEKLDDKTGIDQSALEFHGFSANTETSELQFTRFMMDSMHQLEHVKPKHDLNSHVPMLKTYRRMLRVWMACADRHNLTKEDVIRIASAYRGESTDTDVGDPYEH